MSQDFLNKLSAPALSAAKEYFKRHPEVIGGAVGGLGTFGLQALKNKRKPAAQEETAKSNLKAALEKAKSDKSFSSDFMAMKAKSDKEVAGLMKKHPLKGALLAIPAGAALGAGTVLLGKHLLKQSM
jgi:hypothetical protein